MTTMGTQEIAHRSSSGGTAEIKFSGARDTRDYAELVRESVGLLQDLLALLDQHNRKDNAT